VATKNDSGAWEIQTPKGKIIFAHKKSAELAESALENGGSEQWKYLPSSL